jgi:hypothetical protein
MKRTKFLLITGMISALALSLPVQAIVAYHSGGAGCYHGASGGSADWSHGSGSASGYRGSADWNNGSGSASGYHGSASWNNGSGSAESRQGGTASWNNGSGSYHGANGGSGSWNR